MTRTAVLSWAMALWAAILTTPACGNGGDRTGPPVPSGQWHGTVKVTEWLWAFENCEPELNTPEHPCPLHGEGPWVQGLPLVYEGAASWETGRSSSRTAAVGSPFELFAATRFAQGAALTGMAGSHRNPFHVDIPLEPSFFTISTRRCGTEWITSTCSYTEPDASGTITEVDASIEVGEGTFRASATRKYRDRDGRYSSADEIVMTGRRQ